MDIYEIFALNIQPEQIKRIISLDKHNTQGYDEERKHFLYWLREQASYGYKPENQLVAWDLYVMNFIDTIEFEDYDDEGIYWLRDIEDAFESQVSVRNYNDFGGQQ